MFRLFLFCRFLFSSGFFFFNCFFLCLCHDQYCFTCCFGRRFGRRLAGFAHPLSFVSRDRRNRNQYQCTTDVFFHLSTFQILLVTIQLPFLVVEFQWEFCVAKTVYRAHSYTYMLRYRCILSRRSRIQTNQ